MRLHLFAQSLDLSPLPHHSAVGQGDITGIITLVLQILGMIAVLMAVVGGVRYAASQGDPGQTAQAKNTILYALVGLFLAIIAVTIVKFVSGKLL